MSRPTLSSPTAPHDDWIRSIETVIGIMLLVPVVLFGVLMASEIPEVLLGDNSGYPFGCEEAGLRYVTRGTYLVFISIDLLAAVGFTVSFFTRERHRLMYRAALLLWPAYTIVRMTVL